MGYVYRCTDIQTKIQQIDLIGVIIVVNEWTFNKLTFKIVIYFIHEVIVSTQLSIGGEQITWIAVVFFVIFYFTVSGMNIVGMCARSRILQAPISTCVIDVVKHSVPMDSTLSSPIQSKDAVIRHCFGIV